PAGPPKVELGQPCGCSTGMCGADGKTTAPISLSIALDCCAASDPPSSPPGTQPFFRLDGGSTFLDASYSLVDVFRTRTPPALCGDFYFGYIVTCGAITTSQVNPGSGNLILQVSPPSAGPFDPLPVLTYNSFAIGCSEFGAGWTSTFKRRLFQISATSA